MSVKNDHTAENIASWLFENTGLSFDQIAAFCNLPRRVVEMISDDELGIEISPVNPVEEGYLNEQDVSNCENTNKFLPKSVNFKSNLDISNLKKQRNVVKRRRDKPDAIMWILLNYPEINDYYIMKLVNTTKDTINSVKDRSHWNIGQIVPRDPMTLGLCQKSDFEQVLFKVRVASERISRLKTIIDQNREKNPNFVESDDYND